MIRASITKLVLTNFRSFLGRHELSFAQTGLMILRGRNKDTLGDSGAGKSNVLLAIAYAFGFCPYKTEALQCWYTEESMEVEVHFDTQDGEAVLIRGSKLSLSVGGKKYKGGIKAVEAKLDQLCGVPADLREALTFRSQRKARKFLDLNKRPSERDASMKEFLIQVFHLEDFEAEVARAAKSLGPIEQQVKDSEFLLKAAVDSLDSIKNEVAVSQAIDLGPLVAEVKSTERLVGDLVDQLQDANVERTRLALEAVQAAAKANRLIDGQVKALEATKASTEADKKLVVAASQELLKLEDQKVRGLAHLETVQNQDYAARGVYEIETNILSNKIEDLIKQVRKGQFSKERLIDLQKSQKTLQDSKCPTCYKIWDQAERELREVQDQIGLETVHWKAGIEAERSCGSLEKELRKRAYVPVPALLQLHVILNQIDQRIAVEKERIRNEEALANSEQSKKIALIEAEISKLNASRAQASSSSALADIQKEIQDLTQGYSNAQLRATEARGVLALASQRHDSAMAAMKANSARSKKAEDQVDSCKATLVLSQERLSKESDYVDMIKGFRNKIFDEILEAISQRTTDIVGTLPNSSHISFEFKSERTTGSGNIQDKITPVVYFHGEERDLEESVNGGTLTSVELAVDLAVTQTVSERLGCNLNWIVLDEAFNGHDPVTKLACLEMLQKHAANKLVIIVDHNNEFKEHFKQSVVVEYENKLSKFAE